MPCRLRPDERQRDCNHGSNEGSQRLGYVWKQAEGSLPCGLSSETSPRKANTTPDRSRIYDIIGGWFSDPQAAAPGSCR